MNAYLHFLPMGPLPAGPAGQFLGVLVSTKYATGCPFQVVPAILFLFNRLCRLGWLSGSGLFNILIFHALIQPSGLPIRVVLTVLWLLVFTLFAPTLPVSFKSRPSSFELALRSRPPA